jgi:four helix bundle protein
MKHTKYDLEERLIDFCVLALEAVEDLPGTKAGKYFEDQIIRSSASPALNYGEAQAAESKKDFIHKMKLCLKELRETSISFKIVLRKKMLNTKKVDDVLKEGTELIAIFTKSISTAERNS